MTMKEWLQLMAKTNTSNESDSATMQNLLIRLGFSKAKCVVGMVYLEGEGMPADIHSIASEILKGA